MHSPQPRPTSKDTSATLQEAGGHEEGTISGKGPTDWAGQGRERGLLGLAPWSFLGSSRSGHPGMGESSVLWRTWGCWGACRETWVCPGNVRVVGKIWSIPKAELSWSWMDAWRFEVGVATWGMGVLGAGKCLFAEAKSQKCVGALGAGCQGPSEEFQMQVSCPGSGGVGQGLCGPRPNLPGNSGWGVLNPCREDRGSSSLGGG